MVVVGVILADAADEVDLIVESVLFVLPLGRVSFGSFTGAKGLNSPLCEVEVGATPDPPAALPPVGTTGTASQEKARAASTRCIYLIETG